jgi:hypothetical protein
LRRIVIALVAVLALPACTGDDGATIPRERLARLVLQPADLPRGFSEFDSGRQVRADAHPGPREDRERFGRIDGWKARYRWVGARSAGRPIVLESRADLFDTAGGAKKDLDAYRKELEEPPVGSGLRVTKIEAPKLGDDAIAFRSAQGSLVFVTVAWRRANATASLSAEGFAGRLEPRDVYGLARRQARRLDQAAG